MSSGTAKLTTNTPRKRTIKINTGITVIDNLIEKPRCKNGEHWNPKTQKCEPIKRAVKKVYLGCSRDYVPSEADAPRVAELNAMNSQQLRDIISVLTDTPTGQKYQVMGARRHAELVNVIICIENRRKQQDNPEPEVEPAPAPTVIEPAPIPVIPVAAPPILQPMEESLPTENNKFNATVSPEKTPTPPPTPTPTPPPIPTPQENMETIETTETPPEMQYVVGKPPENKNSKDYNAFLYNKELAENEYHRTNPSGNESIYPSLDDPNFNIKIAQRKEFNDTKYEGDLFDIEERANVLCNADFEILPHQLFVKNFLSFQTPYNALLLYHGLGTGKTCSAIGIAEEMRSFMKQVGLGQRIIVVASPNVQDNFRLQLFDERKLVKDGELWDLNTCIGSQLLTEIDAVNLKGLAKPKIVSKINSIINQYYSFMGYTQFANFMERNTSVSETSGYSENKRKALYVKNIRKIFSNRLIIIDEVHNIRISDDNAKKNTKKTTTLLMEIAKYSENMRLLLLSATPMYNSYKEIIWLTNVLNLIDKRSVIREEDIFDKDGNFVTEKLSENGSVFIEDGKELLQRKLTGYISFVRSENPFTFPYRIYPSSFSAENVLIADQYPKTQMNMKPIEDPIKYVPVFITEPGTYQQKCYDFIIKNLRGNSFQSKSEKILPNFENMEKFGYTILQRPLEALNMVYPNVDFDVTDTAALESSSYENIVSNMVGKQGLSNIMTYKKQQSEYNLRYDFDYKPEVLEKYGRIFRPENISKYSGKISKICDCIKNSTGIVMVYSQFIDGGVVPMALALEEMGFQRFGSATYTQNLLKKTNPPIEIIDGITMKPRNETVATGNTFSPAKYVMITGDSFFSPNNLDDLKYVTDENNKYGANVKVILITKAGAEGLDFKNIRQIHLLEPWYNMNRIEQMIGRGVRNLSHCKLPFAERNVELYLHASFTNTDEETADLYVYRFAEKKAIQIGKITRLMKEIAVDCILHIGQTNFTVEKLLTIAKNQNIVLKLSSQEPTSGKPKEIGFKIGDKPFTDLCDYMDNCSFVCSPNATIKDADINSGSYNTDFLKMNYAAIVKRIRQLFKEQYFYKRMEIINSINILRTYPTEHIDYALSHFVDNKIEYLIDKLGRTGYLINKENIYAFQPVEITDEKIGIFERTAPVDYKRTLLNMEITAQNDNTIDESSPLDISVAPAVETNAETETPKTTTNGLSDTYLSIIKDIKENIETAFSAEDFQINISENNWYKNFNNVFDKLWNYHKIPEETLRKYVLHHLLDTLPFQSRFNIVSYIFKNDVTIETNLEILIKQYFESKIVISKRNSQRGIVLINEEKIWRIYVENASAEWIQLESNIEYRDFGDSLFTNVLFDNERRREYNDLLGFMDHFLNRGIDRGIVFKTKNIKEGKNNTGAFCNNAKKMDVMKRINTIIGTPVYDDAFIVKKRTIYVKNKQTNQTVVKTMDNGIYKEGLCVILEILLRYYDEEKKNGKIWFLDLEKAIVNRIAEHRQ